jgi:hypothetical protein
MGTKAHAEKMAPESIHQRKRVVFRNGLTGDVRRFVYQFLSRTSRRMYNRRMLSSRSSHSFPTYNDVTTQIAQLSATLRKPVSPKLRK